MDASNNRFYREPPMTPANVDDLVERCKRYAVVIEGIVVAPDDWAPDNAAGEHREPKTTLLDAAAEITRLRSLLAAADEEARKDIEIKKRLYEDIQSLQTALDVDGNDIWEAYMAETPSKYRTPQGAIAFTVDRLRSQSSSGGDS